MKNILLTNDDGIFAPGLEALSKVLRPLGRITIVAPDNERSSVSHGITLFQPLWARKIYLRGRLYGHAISGTPADCVKFAVHEILKRKPDLVVSGINAGENDGCSVFYSGTVAAAREAALLGIPALAVSVASFDQPNFHAAAKITARLVKLLRTQKLPKGTFLNVNVPNYPLSRIKGILLTRQGTEPIHTEFRRNVNPLNREYFWMTGKAPAKGKNLSDDTSALAQGYATVVPLQSDLTCDKIWTQWPKNLAPDISRSRQRKI